MAGPSFNQRYVPKFKASSAGGAGVKRLIFTNKASSTFFTKYVGGAGVGAKTIANRRSLLRRSNNFATGKPVCK
jgi:hypothetical protein